MEILYILQNGDTDQYKIGITNNLNRRLDQLQTGCPYELKVVKVWTHKSRKIIEKYERILHRYFTSTTQRIRENGEWFNLFEGDICLLCSPNSTEEQNRVAELLLYATDYRGV